MSSRNKFLVMFAIILGIALGYYLLSRPKENDLALVGMVDANQVIVSAQIQGRIKRLLVEEGSQVKQGDLIAVLDASELEAEKQASAATLASLRSKVSESQYTWESTKGATAGDVANSQARLQAALAQLTQGEATLARVESDTQRAVRLAELGIASEQDRVQAEANLKTQNATVQALKHQVTAAEADLRSAMARTNQATAAQNTVALSRAQLDNAIAALKETEVHLGYTRIYSPVTGTVLVRAAREGEVVSSSQAIVTVVAFDDTWVFASIPETQADHIVLGQTLRVRMPGGTMLPGKVFYKAAEADFATQRDVGRLKRDIRTIALKVRVDNPKGAWVPGMTAEVLVSPSQLAEISGTQKQ